MGRPRNADYSLKEKLAIIKKAGLNEERTERNEKEIVTVSEEEMADLPERIKKMLHIIRDKPVKATDMLSIIMYDIENDKVRTQIAKYLIKKGCIRIQKSVYMLRAEKKLYSKIAEDLKEVQEYYENQDSIILVPIPSNTPGSMQIIGKDIQIDTLVKNPNVLFF